MKISAAKKPTILLRCAILLTAVCSALSLFRTMVAEKRMKELWHDVQALMATEKIRTRLPFCGDVAHRADGDSPVS